jgi:predicted nucleic acid-binding Zn ribbon protein
MTRRSPGARGPAGGCVSTPSDADSSTRSQPAATSHPPGGVSAQPISLRALLVKSHAAAAAAGGIAVDSEVWHQAVGERIARHARPGRLSRGALTVHVSSSVWAQELSLLADELRARLKNHGVEVTALRFTVTASLAGAEKSAVAAPLRPRAPTKRLPQPLEARLAHVDDPELRRVIAEAAAESLALQSRRSRAERPDARVPRSAAPGNAPPDRTRSDGRAGSQCTRATRRR